ncbi:MAG: hypothetical protein WAU01_13825 [Saprospiraceae bacterium]
MENRIEKYIQQNKQLFDQHEPDMAIWSKISDDLDRRQKRNIKMLYIKRLSVAAGVVLVLAFGVLIGLNMQHNNTGKIDYTISPELQNFKETEAYYKTQVSNKFNQLQDANLKSNVSEDLQQLDVIYQQLKDEMISGRYANTQIMIDAMIKNHKTKIEILENILSKQNQQKNENQRVTL